MRWHWKILGAFLLVTGVIVITSSLYLGSSLRSFLMVQLEKDLQRELGLAAQMVQTHIQKNPFASPQIHTLANQMGRHLERRVTLITHDGRVVGDSLLTAKEVIQAEDHARRPEILMAREKGFGHALRYSTTLGANMLYGARPLYKNGDLLGFVRLALPLKQVEGTLAQVRRTLYLTGLGAGLLAVLLSLFLTWGISRPLRDLTEMVKRMAEGDLKQPFHLLPRSEFSILASTLESMATELKGKMELLDEETSRLKAILKVMREGVMVTDARGRILLMNPFLRETLGGRVQWERRLVQEVFFSRELQEAVEAAVNGAPFQKIQYVLTRDTQRFFEVQIVPLIQEKEIQGTLAVFHDTTELRHLLRVRQDFVANASHELRTPLTSLRGYIETLLSLAPGEPPEIKRFLSIMDKNVKRINQLVTDMLDLARLEALEKARKAEEISPLKEMLNEALLAVKDQAAEKGISLSLKLEEALQEKTIPWDRKDLHQALTNLLDNAIKYTPAGGSVHLKAGRASGPEPLAAGEFRDPTRELIEISIKDTGIGIPREHLSRIFERFYRVDLNRSRELGGTGLGLAIVKHVAESHGGRIEVESEVGKGSRFTLIIPA
jgi:two-component system phosphate regulon sensor histidine kinase PhoR